MIISEHLLAELSTVLMRARFRRCLAQSEVRKVIKDLREKGAIFEDIETERLVPDDPKDDYLIALARASGADYLVSGDPHPHGLEGANLPVVLTPRRFWELLEQKAPKKP